MAAAKMNDEELRSKLAELGEDVGPITDSTRSLWQNKLDRLLSEQKTRRRKPSLSQYSSDTESDTKTSKSEPASKPDRPLPRSRRRTLNKSALSEAPRNTDAEFKKPTGTPKSWRTSRQELAPSSSYGTRSSLSRLVRPSLRSVSRVNGSADFESSDSDVDEVSSRRGRASKRASSSILHSTADSSRASSYVTTGVGPRTSTPLQTDTSPDSSELNTTATMWEDSIVDTNHVSPKLNGYSRMDDSSLSMEFKTEESILSHSNFSQWISMLLLAVVTLFFICVAILYLRVRQKDLTHAQTNFNSLLCDLKSSSGEFCINKADLPIAIAMSKHVHNVLRQQAGAFECHHKGITTRHLTYDELKAKLKSLSLPVQGELQFNHAIKDAFFLIKEHPSWGIRIKHKSNQPSNMDTSLTSHEFLESINELESVTADKPFTCRIVQALKKVLFQILTTVLVIVGVAGTWKGVKYYKSLKELRKKQVYGMVEKIIDYLRQHHERYHSQNPSQVPPYVAVLHLRDMLIPPSERKSKQWLWNKAVKFLEENESRVRVEQQSIAGEEFKVWRWLQPSTPEGTSKKGKVWQGQAFGSSGKATNLLPFSPTPCLKIRNMFDPDVEYGDRWHVMIEDAILDKCEGNNGIVHIKVDTSSKEGCVYVKCIDPESAGKAYRALHGWWFDGNLVTVKYLRLERYHEKFPESRNYTTPLKPSNNMRLSLSEPFHSSALERS